MEICVTMHVDGITANNQLDQLSNSELKNVVLMAQLGGIVIDIQSLTQIGNALWDDRKGGPRCELAWDQEFTDALQWHSEMCDNDDDE